MDYKCRDLVHKTVVTTVKGNQLALLSATRTYTTTVTISLSDLPKLLLHVAIAVPRRYMSRLSSRSVCCTQLTYESNRSTSYLSL